MGANRSNFGPPDDELERRNLVAQNHERPLHLSVSNPTQVGLDLPNWGPLLARHFDPTYQPEPRGLKQAREALTHHENSRTGCGLTEALSGTAGLDPESCFLTASTSEGYSFALHALCDPGDAILVPRPSYPLFDQLAQLAGVTLVHYSIVFDGSWHLDLASLPSREVLAHQKIRAIVVVSPNNPTGNVLREEEWNALSELGLPLIIDEVFHPYRHAPCKNAVDPFTRLNPKIPTIIFDGLSKRAAAPGLKLGWAWILGEKAAPIRERFEMISDTFLSASSPVQTALSEILKCEGLAQTAVRSRIHENRELLRELLSETALTWIPSQAGWTEIIRFPAIFDERAWWDLLSEAGILVQAGQLYDLPLTPSFVLSNITPPAVLKRGLERMLRLVNEKLHRPTQPRELRSQ